MLFKFKQFSVEMLDEVFKVGTDASLLGSIVSTHHNAHILDIGTGTGVVALMIAQRHLEALVDAIDISADAVSIAQKNFDNSPFENLNAIQTTAINHNPDYKYDLIVSNPPYHLEGSRSSNSMKDRSKNHLNLPIADLVTCVLNNLNVDGSFWVIAPIPYIEQLSTALEAIKMTVVNCISVKHSDNSKRISRQVVEYKFDCSLPTKEKTLVLYKEQRVFSEEATKLLSPYLIVL